MESSRRSFDRSRELGVKKPRIEEPNPNGHGRPLQKAVTPATGPTARYRSADRDSDSNDSSRGGAYHPQPQQQQYQELVTQYKTALAELTFNSKPIITNLTIIAGENLLAAKAIAATICANILEVPSEQKLPSLYLLDSIVKNIGRDYIKYFAARLPEVFIKAYRQSDPPVHQSMRHLFGTWKGVFPPQTLQMIGKELGFTPLVNGSSTGAASRSDSQSQRPPHSIHVNPKYLERQRLQQSSRAKGMPSDIAGAIAGSTEEMDKSDRASTVTSRPWADPRIKMQNINRSHKDELSDSVHEKNIISAPYEDFEYSSDLSRPSGMGIGKTGGRVIEQGLDKSLYGSGSSASGTISGQRNGLNAKHGLPSYSSLKNANVDSHPKPDQSIVSRTSSGMSSSWKNSEEEEFMWEMHSRVADHDIASLSMNSRKDHRAPHVSKKLGYESHLRKPNSLHDVVSKFERENSADSLPNEQKEQATCGQQTVSPWISQESHSVDGLISSGISSHSQGYSTSFGGLPTNSSSLSRVGDQQQMGSSRIGASGFGFHGTLPQPRFRPLGGASPSGHSPVRQHPPSPPFSARHGRHQLKNITEQDHQLLQPLPRPDFRTSQFSGQLSGYHSTKEPSTVLASDILRGNLQKSQLQLRDFQSSSPSDQTQRPPSTIVNSAPENSDPLAAGTSGQLSTSSLLAEVMKSGIFSNNTINVKTPNRGSLDTVQVLSKPTIQPPLPRAPTPALAATDISETRVEQTPLSLSPAPSLSQTSDAVSKTPDPISNLLSSLVAKGLISASETETSTTMSSQTPSQLKGVDSITATPISTPVTFVPTSLGGSRLSIMDETSVSEPTGNSSDSLPQSSKIWAKNIVGLKFKPDLIREMHPDVINGLFDDLPHCCSICGLRLRLREQLDRHLVWHASLKAPEPGGLSRASRGWYSNAEDWIYGRAGLPLVSDSAVPVEESEEGTDGNAAMVPADENRCVCVLCGGLFEDFFCQERNGWMFKGAMYLTRPLGDGEMETAHEGDVNVPIVHADCMSREFSS